MSNESSWWSWGSSIINTVKEKSQNIYDVYKHDLTEFTSTVASDTTKVITDNKQQLERAKITETFTAGLSVLSEGLTGSLNTLTNLTAKYTSGSTEETELVKQINQLQKDPQTFNQKPEDAKFVTWAASFDMESKKDEIQYNLANNVDLMQMYSDLVPNVITSKEFWERYYFRLEMVKEEEEKRAAILARAKNLPDVDLNWDDFDDEEANKVQKKQEPQELPEAPSATVATETTTEISSTIPQIEPPSTPQSAQETEVQNNSQTSPQEPDSQQNSQQSTETKQPTKKVQKSPGGKRIGADGKEDDDWLNWG